MKSVRERLTTHGCHRLPSASICHPNMWSSTCVPARLWLCHCLVFCKVTQSKMFKEQRWIIWSGLSQAMGKGMKGAKATVDLTILFLTSCRSWASHFSFLSQPLHFLICKMGMIFSDHYVGENCRFLMLLEIISPDWVQVLPNGCGDGWLEPTWPEFHILPMSQARVREGDNR